MTFPTSFAAVALRRGFGALCALSALLVLTASLPLRAQPTTLIAVGDNYCPYNCPAGTAQRGYLVDILERALRDTHAIDYRLEPWTRAVAMVNDGQAQILVSTAAGTGRRLLLTEPLGIEKICFFVRQDNPWRYTTLADLSKLRLAAIQDYFYDDKGPLDQLIADYRAKKDARLELSYGKEPLISSLRKLEAGRADVVVENENVALYAIQQLGLEKTLKQAGCAKHYQGTLHLGIAPRVANAKTLIQRINQETRHMRSSGELSELLARYGISDWAPTKK